MRLDSCVTSDQEPQVCVWWTRGFGFMTNSGSSLSTLRSWILGVKVFAGAGGC